MVTTTNRTPVHGTRPGATRRRSMAAVIAALAAFGLAAVAVPATAQPARQPSGPPCLWAGISDPQRTTVYAGGWEFNCETEFFGSAR